MYLLDHPNPHGNHFYTTRRQRLVGFVIHCTAGLEDLDLQGIDHSAEDTARYAATTSRVVSWHSGSDTDSVVELLPPHYTAFHCRGYNSSTYGHEISKRDMVWADEPADWVTATLERPAAHLREKARAAGVPIRQITRAQLDAAIAHQDPSMGGFVGHAPLDPTRRTDPGADFPWSRFLTLVAGTKEDPMTHLQARLEVATAWYAKAGVWMDNRGNLSESPTQRLTRLAEEVRKGERTVAEIVQHVVKLKNPIPGEPLPAWVLDRTAPYGSLTNTGGGLSESQVRAIVEGHSHRATVKLS